MESNKRRHFRRRSSAGRRAYGDWAECRWRDVPAAYGPPTPIYNRYNRWAMLAVLDRAAEMSRWREAAPEGTARGLAVVESYGSYVAQVVEAQAGDEGITVDRVYAAIDCGRAINPDQVETQIQGAVIDALGVALRQKVTIRDGRAEQSNFHDYPLLRIEETPEIPVSIVETGSPLGGVDEPGIPPLAPALANALFAATRQRVRSLPLSDHV